LYDLKLLDNLALHFPEMLGRLAAVITMGVDQIASELGFDAQCSDMVEKGSSALEWMGEHNVSSQNKACPLTNQSQARTT
jgi:hypothetical protein